MVPYLIANWKTNLMLGQSLSLSGQLVRHLLDVSAEVVICPSFISLPGVADYLKTSKVKLGAQDLARDSHLTLTGEIRAEQLVDLGVDYVLIGHGERRRHLAETDQIVNQKVKQALDNKLIPIVCLGEPSEVYHAGGRDAFVLHQLQQALAGVNLLVDTEILIAYEPLWAIGSSQKVDPQEVAHLHQVIRQGLLDLYSASISQTIPILYGGNVTVANAPSFLAQPEIAGLLLGRVSLELASLLAILRQLG